jgi:hypothetical protein
MTPRPPFAPIDARPAAQVIDARAMRTLQKGKGRILANGKPHVRSPAAIDSIVLHQAGVMLPPGKRRMERFASRALACADRALAVAAHVVVFRETATDPPLIVLAAPLRWTVYHANSLNGRSIGIEVEGCYADDRGRSWSPLHPVVPLTDATAAAVRYALAVVESEAWSEGIEVTRLWAHRQASTARPNCPGPELWKAARGCGMLLAEDEVHGGTAVPETWRT